MTKLVVLMPTRGLIFTKAEQALEDELLANEIVPFILRTDNAPLPEARNVLVEQGLTIDADYYLMMDDDVIMPEGGLKALLAAMEAADIAFIDYPMHYTGEKWGGMGTATFDDWLPGQPTKGKPVAWAGLGCTLVKRSVLEAIGKPWFDRTARTFTRDDTGHITMGPEERGLDLMGEDVYFFLKAKEAGFTVKAIDDMFAGHARLVRAVLALQEGKYTTQHKIAVNDRIKGQYR